MRIGNESHMFQVHEEPFGRQHSSGWEVELGGGDQVSHVANKRGTSSVSMISSLALLTSSSSRWSSLIASQVSRDTSAPSVAASLEITVTCVRATTSPESKLSSAGTEWGNKRAINAMPRQSKRRRITATQKTTAAAERTKEQLKRQDESGYFRVDFSILPLFVSQVAAHDRRHAAGGANTPYLLLHPCLCLPFRRCLSSTRIPRFLISFSLLISLPASCFN